MRAGDLHLSPKQIETIDEAGRKGADMGYGKYDSWVNPVYP